MSTLVLIVPDLLVCVCGGGRGVIQDGLKFTWSIAAQKVVEQKDVSSLDGSRRLGLALLVRKPLSQGKDEPG